MIIDLSYLNTYINKISLKMEGIPALKFLIEANDYMVSIDLSDAFFSIPLHAESKRYATFHYKQKYYQFNVLPFGLTCFPRIFTKVLHLIIVYLRAQGIQISAYIDDLIIAAQCKNKLLDQCKKVKGLLLSLGFTINAEKSVCAPMQVLLHLGYLWNSSTIHKST